MNQSFPDEDLPEGAVVDGMALGRPFDDSYDFVVVGSGAAGAVAAHTLAESGASVALVEEGPWVKTRDFGDRVYDAFRGMYRDAGTQVLEGDSYIPLIQGACVGGSTVMNSAIAWRPPEEVLVDWQRRFGLGDVASMKVLEPHFDALEAALGARGVQDEVLGENNRIFLEQAEKQGISAVRTRRYERGCRGSGRCMTGCPTAAKQGMNVSYVPWALRLGARIFTSCRVDRVVIVSGRAVGIVARAKGGHPVHLRARRGVLVAASAVQTPNLLRRSGLRARDLGEHFQAHPGLGMGGVFDRPVHMEFGATQGADIEQFRTSDGIKLETISMPPELAAVRIPGIGRELMNRLAVFSNLAVWALIVRSDSEGRVTTGWGGRDKVVFSLSKRDLERVRGGMARLASLFFDAGALEVWPGVFGIPSALTSADQVKLLEDAPLDARAFSFIATHLFGTARMGPERKGREGSVVGLDFQTHEAERLYVVDSSVFPTNLGVNPQHTIMALARLASVRVLEA